MTVRSVFYLTESLNDIWFFMPADLLADWFQQPYVRVEMKSNNLTFGLLIVSRKCLDKSVWGKKKVSELERM